MPPSILKLAPQAVVLTAALYWSWPALVEFLPAGAAPRAKAEKSDEPAAFSAAMLSPVFPTVPKRNPFLPPGADFSTAAKSGRPGEKKGEIAKTVVEAKDAGLVLGATCIVGGCRMASINGRIYKEKEAIESTGDLATSFIVTEIGPHEVLLLSEGQTLQLKYNDGVKPSVKTSGAKPSAAKPSLPKPSGSPRRSAS